MANINLLPWREEAREKEKKEFTATLIGMVVLTVLLAFLANWIVSQYVDGQRQRNAYLQGQIKELEQAISEIELLKKRKSDLQQRMGLIARLRASRNVTAHIFDTVADSVPPGMYLTEMKRDGDDLSVKGKTESNNRVSSLIRYIKESEWLVNPEPRRIQSVNKSSALSDFDLGVQVRLDGVAPAPAAGGKK
ncbi:PilN domain-containing protein [Gallaecimonas pentaromativorans]|uniref:PilN domain-containing protein n=1 Tax=Gallaecimonas pentaromativorans TaxID=584787 RepID=UPI00067E6D8C|nr:PilN domain-containing protein [Gallaecimonas pentaromativorans]MED5526833.1 PilN domain-containing protein [Pseudomonadota bacterium]